MAYKTGSKGKDLIRYFEGLHDGNLTKIGLQPKLCPASIFTTCWGHAIIDPVTGKFIKADTPNGYERACELFPDLTLEQAEQLLEQDLVEVEAIVNKVKVKLTQDQFDALVSHTFNCGVSETLYKLINTMPLNSESIAIWWKTKYISANGKKLNGLVKRRKIEYELFSTGNLKL